MTREGKDEEEDDLDENVDEDVEGELPSAKATTRKPLTGICNNTK